MSIDDKIRERLCDWDIPSQLASYDLEDNVRKVKALIKETVNDTNHRVLTYAGKLEGEDVLHWYRLLENGNILIVAINGETGWWKAAEIAGEENIANLKEKADD